tara:strand:+ start:7975 stop:8808 length:834 start_codon:yes stop_codon:yes gene_type:complete
MSQHDYNIANGTGAAVRSDINLALTAIAGANSGTTAPTTTYAYQLWADTHPTTGGNLKIRNGGDSAWIVVGSLSSANLGLMLASRFPNVTGNVTASHTELNHTDGVTSNIQTQLNSLASLGIVMTSIYPVGHVYTSVVSTNPANLLAGMSSTTWVAFGSGKTLVGLDSNDGDFNQIEETGGAKTDTTAVGGTSLSIAQLPPHGHPYAVTSTSTPVSGNSGGFMTSSYAGSYGPNNGAVSSSAGNQIGGAGSGSTHTHTTSTSVVQPYIVVYFWKRTA